MLRYAFPLVVVLAMATPALACEGDQACCADHKSAAADTHSGAHAQPAGLKAGEARHTFKVTGMVCAGCSKKITKALSLEAGVVKADVNAETGEATIIYLTGKVTEAKLLAVIEKAGFKVEKPASTSV